MDRGKVQTERAQHENAETMDRGKAQTKRAQHENAETMDSGRVQRQVNIYVCIEPTNRINTSSQRIIESHGTEFWMVLGSLGGGFYEPLGGVLAHLEGVLGPLGRLLGGSWAGIQKSVGWIQKSSGWIQKSFPLGTVLAAILRSKNQKSRSGTVQDKSSYFLHQVICFGKM